MCVFLSEKITWQKLLNTELFLANVIYSSLSAQSFHHFGVKTDVSLSYGIEEGRSLFISWQYGVANTSLSFS